MSRSVQAGQNLLHIVKVCKKLESSFHLLLTHSSALLSPFHLPQRTKMPTSNTSTATCRKAAQTSHFIQAHSRLLRRSAVPKLLESDNCSRSAAISAVISVKAASTLRCHFRFRTAYSSSSSGFLRSSAFSALPSLASRKSYSSSSASPSLSG